MLKGEKVKPKTELELDFTLIPKTGRINWKGK